MSFIFSKSRYLVLIAVISSLVSAALTFLWGAYKTYIVILHAVTSLDGKQHKIRVEAIAIMDIFLIATALLIFAFGLYRLFVGRIELPDWLVIESLDDLKDKLRGVIIFVMVVAFLEHLVEWTDPAGTLMFGGAIAIIIACLIAVEVFRKDNHGTPEGGTE